MLGFHLLLVILHGWFTNSIELDDIKQMTPNTMLSVDFVTNPPKGDGSNTII